MLCKCTEMAPSLTFFFAFVFRCVSISSAPPLNTIAHCQVTLEQMQALEAALATVDQHAANALRGRFSQEPRLLTSLIGVNNQINVPLLRCAHLLLCGCCCIGYFSAFLLVFYWRMSDSVSKTCSVDSAQNHRNQ